MIQFAKPPMKDRRRYEIRGNVVYAWCHYCCNMYPKSHFTRDISLKYNIGTCKIQSQMYQKTRRNKHNAKI